MREREEKRKEMSVGERGEYFEAQHYWQEQMWAG